MAKWIAAHWYLLVAWLLIANIAAFALMGADKRRAVEGRWRIPERTLYLPALLGGAPGALLGMRIFHHKTKKPLFCHGMPALCVIEGVAMLALAVWLVMRR